MPIKDSFIDEVVHLLNAQKSLASFDVPPQWRSARDGVGVEAKFIVEVAGTQYGDKVTIVAVPSEKTFHINLIHRDLCVSRLDFDPMQPHTNTLRANDYRLPLIVSGKHFHRWSHNTRFVKGDGTLDRLLHAEELPVSVQKFDQALRWFCSEIKIDLPHGHAIDYPSDLL